MHVRDIKVESLIYYSNPLKGKYYIIEQSTDDIQRIVDEYIHRGYRLISTDTTIFGSALYIYLYFERYDPAGSTT